MAVSRLFLTMIGRSEGNVQVYMPRTISQDLSPFLFSSTTNIQLFSFKKTTKPQKLQHNFGHLHLQHHYSASPKVSLPIFGKPPHSLVITAPTYRNSAVH